MAAGRAVAGGGAVKRDRRLLFSLRRRRGSRAEGGGTIATVSGVCLECGFLMEFGRIRECDLHEGADFDQFVGHRCFEEPPADLKVEVRAG